MYGREANFSDGIFKSNYSVEERMKEVDQLVKIRDRVKEIMDKDKQERESRNPVKPTELKKGDLVWLKEIRIRRKQAKKLQMKWRGPYRIHKILSTKTVILEKLDGTKILEPVNMNRIKKMKGDLEDPREKARDQDERIEEMEYEVEDILSMRISEEEIQEYRIRWKDYQNETWEPETNLFCQSLLRNFHENSHKCEQCGYETLSKNGYKTHMREHEEMEIVSGTQYEK